MLKTDKSLFLSGLRIYCGGLNTICWLPKLYYKDVFLLCIDVGFRCWKNYLGDLPLVMLIEASKLFLKVLLESEEAAGKFGGLARRFVVVGGVNTIMRSGDIGISNTPTFLEASSSF